MVVLSRGMHRRLQVCPETLRLLEERGVKVRVLQTEEAAAVYNELAGKVPVGDSSTRPADRKRGSPDPSMLESQESW